jgi:hypothetical protein
MWVISVLGIIILYLVYAYLKGLSTCDCVVSLYVTRLKYMEAIMLGINVLALGLTVLSAANILSFLKNYQAHLPKLIASGSLAALIFYGYFAYNTYFFQKTMKDNCKCADGWEKYYIYFQSIIAFIAVLFSTILAGYVGYLKIPVGDLGEQAVKKVLSSTAKRVKSITRSRK